MRVETCCTNKFLNKILMSLLLVGEIAKMLNTSIIIILILLRAFIPFVQLFITV